MAYFLGVRTLPCVSNILAEGVYIGLYSSQFIIDSSEIPTDVPNDFKRKPEP